MIDGFDIHISTLLSFEKEDEYEPQALHTFIVNSILPPSCFATKSMFQFKPCSVVIREIGCYTAKVKIATVERIRINGAVHQLEIV